MSLINAYSLSFCAIVCLHQRFPEGNLSIAVTTVYIDCEFQASFRRKILTINEIFVVLIHSASHIQACQLNTRAFRFGEKLFDSIHADESIFRFDSIGQFDKTDACTLIVTHRLIITYDYFLIVCNYA